MHWSSCPRISGLIKPRRRVCTRSSPQAYALYEGALQWRAESPAVVLALLGEPLFQRSPEHYMSHLQTPFDHTTAYAALAHSGKVALVAL